MMHEHRTKVHNGMFSSSGLIDDAISIINLLRTSQFKVIYDFVGYC